MRRASRRITWGVLGALALGACGTPTTTPAERARATSGDEERQRRELETAGATTTATGGGGDAVVEEQGEAETPSDVQVTQSTTSTYRTSVDVDVQTTGTYELEPAPVAPSTSPPSDDAMTLSVGSTSRTIEDTPLPNIGTSISREPSPIALVGFAIAPSVPTRVLIGTLELPPGERWVPPVSSCQDTLLYVSSGTLDASGTGIASVDTPATLYAGDALRFGPEGDGLVVNTSSEPVRTIVALARAEEGGPARVALEERGDRALCPDPGTSDPLSRPQRVASFATSPPLVVMDGALEVRILLDADAAGAEHAGLAVLTGTADFAVPEHVHDGAAEVLYFEEGTGTMHVGAHDVAIAPGVTVYVPEGTPHSFEPSGSGGMRALQFYAPSGPEQRFRGMAEGG